MIRGGEERTQLNQKIMTAALFITREPLSLEVSSPKVLLGPKILL
jgi:hypothetical protein